MEEEYINILNRIGSQEFLDEESKKVLISTGDGYYINYSENWEDERIKSLENSDLINVFKGLIFAENCYNQLCGSTSIGVVLYQEIAKRKLDGDLKIANWAFTKTINDYIPFGSGARIRARSSDAYDFLRNCENHEREVIQGQINKRIRLLNEKIKGLKNLIGHNEQKIAEQKHRLSFLHKSNAEIADIIIRDNRRAVYFYCKEIEQIIEDKSVHRNLLEMILSKFKNVEKRTIKVLKNRLTEEINSR